MTVKVLLLTFLCFIPPYACRTVDGAPSWLRVGVYAEYSLSPWSPSGVTVMCYNASLDMSNCSLWKDGGYTEYHKCYSVLYRWEVREIDGDKVSLDVSFDISGWREGNFTVTVDSGTGETYTDSDLFIGFSRLWLTSFDDIPVPFISNPSISYGVNVQVDKGIRDTIQGSQRVVGVMVDEEDYRPPLEGSRSPFSISVSFDEDTGLAVSYFMEVVLPFGPDVRLICMSGGLELSSTNIDLGPPVPVGDVSSGLLLIGGMVGLGVALMAVFYMARRRSRAGRRRKVVVRRRRR